MKYLFIALSTKGYGETILGLRVAQDLHKSGNECFFLIHDSATSLLSETPFLHVKTSDHTLGLLKLTLLSSIKKLNPDSIILSDYFTADLAFSRENIEPSFFKNFDFPVGAIDTWDLQRSGTEIDVFGSERRVFQDWSAYLDYRLIPAPIAKPYSDAAYYCCLPEPINVPKKVSQHVRRDLGISPDERLVLFCTAAWQHASFNSEHANRLARLLPHLISQYIEQLGPQVHLVHVGPTCFSLELGDRYHWLPAVPPGQFEMLLAGTDFLLSANASSTTIAQALVSGIPSMVLMNSQTISSLENLQSSSTEPLSDVLIAWVKKAAPIYPFYMWPIGYYDFLCPLLDDNPYCDVVPMLEIFREKAIVELMQSILFDEHSRELRIESQLRYVNKLRRLPSASSLISLGVENSYG